MMKALRQIWKSPELRNSIMFVIAMLVVFRIASHIPVPGVNAENLKAFFASSQVLGLVNIFSGGSLRNFSVVALGVGPYITASIIFQLLAMIIPRLEEMQKDGEAGQQKINQYTRIATVPLAMLQAYSMIALLRQSQKPIIGALSPLEYVGVLTTMAAGTLLLMWIGELISERKIGNGVSILIFAGIIANLPNAVQQAILTFDPSQIFTLAAYAVIGVLTIAGVVFITEGQRNIPVIYAKSMRGTKQFGGAETYLPLRALMAGVIPIIFAVSIIIFPTMISQLFLHAKTAWVAAAATQTIAILQNQLIYGIAFFLLVFIFTYFYTAVVFHPDQVAENLQKQGGYVPGIRPGRPTAEYLMKTVNRIIPAGGLFLAAIAVLPLVAKYFTNSQSLAIGGTGMLIVVSVVIEIVNQVNAQLMMREYETL